MYSIYCPNNVVLADVGQLYLGCGVYRVHVMHFFLFKLLLEYLVLAVQAIVRV